MTNEDQDCPRPCKWLLESQEETIRLKKEVNGKATSFFLSFGPVRELKDFKVPYPEVVE